MNPPEPTPTQNAPQQPEQPLTTDTHTTNNQNQTWRNNANCTGKTNMMFPKNYKDITYIPAARALCKECTVQTQCLEYALEFPSADLHGVWAGYTPRQLAAEQRRRGIKPIRPTLAQMWAERR
jgi:hypothetical protein